MGKLLRRKEAARYLEQTWGVIRAPSTLAKLAVVGGGPSFRRFNRVPYYDPQDLDTWVASVLSEPLRSTSEATSTKGSLSGQPELGSVA
jgi:hypothetical protein